MATITITHKTTIAELLTIFCFIPVLTLAKVVKAILTAICTARTWLNTRYDFSNEEGEIHMTGWQYLGFGLLTSVFALLLSIDWESVI